MTWNASVREVMIIAWQRVRERQKRYQSSYLPTYLPGNLKIFLVVPWLIFKTLSLGDRATFKFIAKR